MTLNQSYVLVIISNLDNPISLDEEIKVIYYLKVLDLGGIFIAFYKALLVQLLAVLVDSCLVRGSIPLHLCKGVIMLITV